MNRDELLRSIRNTTSDQWIFIESANAWCFAENVNIWIEQIVDHPRAGDAFQEPWATSFPDPSAARQNYVLHYGSTPVKEVVLIAVDGGRAVLPMPRSRTDLTVSAEDYAIAKAIDVTGSLDDYLQRAGMQIR